ncbi:outer membrane beta-barrel domain-containing protein [Pseudobdellovibrio sp. HCB154]|uniref:outer membrane beta-barrel domain-containing protein n=1 Tax=Pseudobdellovibrio sp. HCB154 TaxID=3386277 RepID=UPI003916E68F
MKLNSYLHLILVALLAAPLSAQAQQSLDDDDIVSVEGMYSTPPAKETKQENEALPSQLKQTNQQQTEVKDLKDLNRLAPFSEVSVIQKKFMPKTQRFQLFAAGTVMTNTPWYNNVGAKLNLSYNFTESFGLEINSMFLTNAERESTKEIKEAHNLLAEQFIYTKSYVGLDLVWSPIYGKVSSLDDTIVPFDMYFSLGGGTSSTNSQEGSNATIHVGLGQIFAISKSMAFRWDYSFNTFSATPVATATSGSPEKSNYNDLVLSAGISFFFPEASYR